MGRKSLHAWAKCCFCLNKGERGWDEESSFRYDLKNVPGIFKSLSLAQCPVHLGPVWIFTFPEVLNKEG